MSSCGCSICTQLIPSSPPSLPCAQLDGSGADALALSALGSQYNMAADAMHAEMQTRRLQRELLQVRRLISSKEVRARVRVRVWLSVRTRVTCDV
jgi:hypothetical protein